ncbi:MAG TPA: Dam family site-specific DNA-(adenine-N6)-methyltransferase, partial [Draconibacterium sp.]|nr:Dam family site-specific DNA-(adenine-N6)-methyltransferase [Draconibacterium sp.]
MLKKSLNKSEFNIQDRGEIAFRVKPFLKWAGGKGQLLDIFQDFYPRQLVAQSIENYYEPFVGGGAVFFDIARKFNIKSAFLYDVNEELILTYRVVQQDAPKLIEHLEKHQKKYQKLDEEKQGEYFYKVRQSFNNQRTRTNFETYSEKWISRAAQTIFLNKTCFNGLFRFNSKGEFNTPKGRYKNPKILDAEAILKTSELLGIAEIKMADFRQVEKDIKLQSFVYYDPPYRPLNKTSSFTAYSKNSFTDNEQKELADVFHRLNEKGIYQMLSNSDPKNMNPNDNFFDELYSNYLIFRVPAKRMINSNGAKRS